MPREAIIALVAVLAAVAGGIAVWTMLPAFRGAEAARRDIGSHRLAFGCSVTVVLLGTLMSLPLGGALAAGFTLTTFALAALATEIPIVLVLYVRLIWPGAVTWQELGLRPLPIWRIVSVGFTTGVFGLIVTITLSLALSQLGLRSNQLEQYLFVREANPLGLVVVLVLVGGTAPIVEELYFRGFLFGLYQRRQPLWVAYLVSGVIFALAHVMPTRMSAQQGASLAVGILALGTLLSFTYQRTGSLFPGMLAHALNNATGVLALYAVGTGI